MKLLIAGDYVPIGRFANCLYDDKLYDFGIIRSFCEKVDYSIVNFEAPVCDGKGKGIFKNGPNLCASKNAVEGIHRLGFDAVTLANNHFRDYGEEGVNKTLETLTSLGIDYVGGGRNIAEANKILYKQINNEVLALINFCENEFSVATSNRGGSMPLDLVLNLKQIQDCRQNADYVVVIVHGGHENYQLPSPRMKNLYRFFIDMGVDAVINHHQHCFSGYEVYEGSPIFYGLGNFIFDWPGKRKCDWNEGFFVTLDLNHKVIEYSITPYCQCDEKPGLYPLQGDEVITFQAKLESLNKIIDDDIFLEKEFQNLIKRKASGVKATLSLFTNRYLMALISRGFLPSFISKKKAAMMYNYISCEAHRDITLGSLKEILECD